MRSSSSRPLRAERMALVATGMTSSMCAAWQNEPNTFAVRTARSIGSGCREAPAAHALAAADPLGDLVDVLPVAAGLVAVDDEPERVRAHVDDGCAAHAAHVSVRTRCGLFRLCEAGLSMPACSWMAAWPRPARAASGNCCAAAAFRPSL